VPFRKLYRKKLNSYLEIADDEGFMQLLWAANALQADAEHAAAPYLDYRYPKTAITTDLTDRAFIYKWELETLANEALATPKRNHEKHGRIRTLNTKSYEGVVSMANVLRKLENVESAHGLNDRSVFREMARIANRQFDWQRGYFNLPQFYRNAFVYGQGACADYFKTRHGITINQLSLVGFCMYVLLAKNPVFRGTDMSAVGIDSEDLERALALIARPISEMRSMATEERSTGYYTAYRASVLRRFPCIIFGDRNYRVRAPLPPLILERVTSGVFYDVVGGGGAVRHDYGRRFEEYCIKYLRAMLPELDWRGEAKYRAKGNEMSTPDILLVEGTGLGLAIECKATRMGYSAKFGEDELDERGYEEIIKAVFQLWRFFSHSRRGLTGFMINTDAVGAVLTLDSWLQMANPLQDEVLSAASNMAAAKDPEILDEDKKPIAFFAVASMEATLVRATAKSFLQAVRAATNPEFVGWMLSSVHERFEEKDQPEKHYPFRSDMGNLLPWWDNVPARKVESAAIGTGD
jgi:hypothetical protein